ncbi:MAG TPA: DUF2550 domain-containing protein [Streptosporangiaceae bacterium]|nr:DUF2550 domain-containing protein [Streptosporangiaceae bacterium]
MTGELALTAGWTLLLVLAVSLIAAVVLASRRILLGRAGGTVECGLRETKAATWRLGLAAYQPNQLQWYSAFGIRLRPNEVFDRRSMSVLARRPAAQSEAASIGAGTVVVECRTGRDGNGLAVAEPAPRTVELAMSEEALTGFLSWLESAPPGHLSGLS